MSSQFKVIFIALIVFIVIVVMAILAAVLFIKLSNLENAANFYAAKQTIIYGFVFFVIIFALLIGAIKFVEIYYEKRKADIEKHENYLLGNSELMRFLHNELKRYDGNEKFFLSKEENVLLLLAEISDLYKVARIEHRRKSRTAPQGIEPELSLEIDDFIEEQRKKLIDTKKRLSNGKQSPNNYLKLSK